MKLKKRMSVCLESKAWRSVHQKSSCEVYALQKNVRKPAVFYSTAGCKEDMVHSAVPSDINDMDNMNTICRATQIIRKNIVEFKEKPGNAIPVSSNIGDVPSELYTMIRWITVGPDDNLEHENRTSAVDRMVPTVSQNILYGFKPNRQVKYKPRRDNPSFRRHNGRENPQVLELAPDCPS